MEAITQIKVIEDIENKLRDYRRANQRIEERRKRWKEDLKPLTKKVLEAIVTQTDMSEANVKVNEDTKNTEAVYLEMKERDSGIASIEGEDIEKPKVKKGGYLFFVQLYNGKISIMIVYPTIEGVTKVKEPKTVETLEPEDIDESVICRNVVNFLDEMAQWEDNEPGHKTIGF